MKKQHDRALSFPSRILGHIHGNVSGTIPHAVHILKGEGEICRRGVVNSKYRLSCYTDVFLHIPLKSFSNSVSS